MSQPFNNFVDNLELSELRSAVQSGRGQEVLARLYKLAAAYPDNPELAIMIKQTLVGAVVAQPVPQQSVSKQLQTKRKRDVSTRTIVLVGVAGFLALLVSVVVVLLITSKPGPEAYKLYPTDREMIRSAYVGERVRFQAYTLIGAVFSSITDTKTTPAAPTENDNPHLIRLDLDENSSTTMDFSHFGNGLKPKDGSFTVLGKVSRRDGDHIYVDVEDLIYDNSKGRP